MVLVWIAKLVAALNANVRPAEIAAGFAYAVLLALIPAGNLLWIALFILSFFLKINNAVFFVFMAILKLFISVFDPVCDAIGWSILHNQGLSHFFTSLSNTPLIPWTRFNDTVVTGGLVLGLFAFIPLTVLGILFVRAWRNVLREKLANWGPVKAFMRWPLVSAIGNLVGKVLAVTKELV